MEHQPDVPPSAATPNAKEPTKLGVLWGISRVKHGLWCHRVLLEANSPEAAETTEELALLQKLSELEILLSAADAALSSPGSGGVNENMSLPDAACQPRDAAALAPLTPAVQRLLSDHVRAVNRPAMEQFLAEAKCWTVKHAAALVERHVRVPGLSKRELRDFRSAAEEAHEAELANAGW